jgi:hypothetical protein
MRRILAAVVVSACLLPLCGCGEEGGVPAACREGAPALVKALREAPGPVTLGGTPLSGCIRDTSNGGDLQEVGQAYVYVGTRLADAAAEKPESRAALELGYLIGALRRGEAGAQNVGHELERRLRSELPRVDSSSASFRRGERAGRDHG